MHNLIIWFRHLRHIAAFVLGARTLIIILMVLGIWVATHNLNPPLAFSLNDKLIHTFVFFVFSLLMDLASSRHPFWLWKGLPLLIYGACIEVLQYFSPDRSFEFLDWVADFSGILLYFLIKSALLWMDSRRLSDT